MPTKQRTRAGCGEIDSVFYIGNDWRLMQSKLMDSVFYVEHSECEVVDYIIITI